MSKEKSKLRTQLVVITPTQASNWLSKNTANRPLREKTIQYLTRQIQKGKWETGTDSIGFDTDGKLINGQHRLHACVRANKDIECLVTYGLDPAAFSVIDTGMIRTAGDVLGVNGFKTPMKIASVIKFIISFTAGLIHAAARGGGPARASNQEVLEFAEKHRLELEDTHEVMNMVLKEFQGLPPKIVGGLYFMFRKIDRDYAMSFFQYLSTGVGLKQDDPIYQLRKRLIDDMKSKKKFPERDKIALTILAWNHTRKGSRITKLQWVGDGKSSFPKPI